MQPLDGRADRERRGEGPLRRAGPRPMRDAGRPHRRGAHTRLHERRGPAADPRDPRDPLLQPLAPEIWRKGATSGNVQRLRQLRYDCDGDALVALVEPAGPACHTGERSCFYRDLEGTADPGAMHRRSAVSPRRPEALPRSSCAPVAAPASAPRAATRSSCSTTRAWSATRSRRKPRRSAAQRRESDERVAEEGADVLYHLAVLLLSRGRRGAAGVGGAQWRVAATTSCGLEPGPRSRPRAGRTANARPGPLPLHRRLRDAGLRLPEAARRRPRLPARIRGAGPVGRWSFLGFRPRSILRWSEGARSERVGAGSGRVRPPTGSPRPPDPYAAVAEYLARFEIAEPEELPPFAGGAVGFFGYDLVRTVEPLGKPNPRPGRPPRHGADDHRRAGGLRSPAARGDADR